MTQRTSTANISVSGITHAFLTRLDDIDGFDDRNESDGKTSGLWYLYGRKASIPTGSLSASSQPSPAISSRRTFSDSPSSNSRSSADSSSSDGLYVWTSTDLRHWSEAGQVLQLQDIPWVPADHGHKQNPGHGYDTRNQAAHDRNLTVDNGTSSNQQLSDHRSNQPMHPAVMRYKGRIYLYFEVDGQIGVAWSSRPDGPFTVRRTPIVRVRQWGRATDPGVLGLPVEVDEFGQILPVSNRPVRTDWLVWGLGGEAVTLCTLGEDRMELALGVHRSREIRIAPEMTPGDVSRFGSPQVIRLGGTFYLLWIDDAGQILSASAPHLGGPWKKLGPVTFDDTNAGTSAKTNVPLRLSIAADTAGESAGPRNNPGQAILTVSGQTSTHFFVLRPEGTQLHSRA